MNSTNSTAAPLPRQAPNAGPSQPATKTPSPGSGKPPKPGTMTPLETSRLKAKPSGPSRHATSTTAAAVLIGILAAYATTPSTAGAGVERLRELLDDVMRVCGDLKRHAPFCVTAREHHSLTKDFRTPVLSTPSFLETNSTWLLLGTAVLILYLHLKQMRAI